MCDAEKQVVVEAGSQADVAGAVEVKALGIGHVFAGVGPVETRREGHAGGLEERACERVVNEAVGAVAFEGSGCGEAERGDGRPAEDFAGVAHAVHRIALGRTMYGEYPRRVPNRASLAFRGASQSIPDQRDRLVAGAVALADREGLAAVSIRRVAAELGVRPMSIYTYIASKDELFDLMAEAVVSEVLVTAPLPSDWRAAVEAIAIQSHHVFVAHPWLAAISHARPDLGANALHHAEQLLSAIAPLDLPAEKAWEVLFLINDYTLGHAVRVAHAPPTAGNYPPFDSQQFPRLAATIHSAGRRSDDTFLAGLGRILDGIANARPGASTPERRGSRTSAADPTTPKRARRVKQNSGTGG